MTPTIIALVGSAIVAPVVTLITLWFNLRDSESKRTDKKIDGYIRDLQQEIATLKSDINAIKIELKNRDAEYVTLYQAHTTLRAKYENLQMEHDQLKKQYDNTSNELAQLKSDIKNEAVKAADSIAKI